MTGQETFFPEKLVCKRIETILNMKDEILLDELARKLSGEDDGGEVLTVVRAFGEKRFKKSDIDEVYLINKAGEKKDVTQEVIKIFDAKSHSKSGISGLFKKR